MGSVALNRLRNNQSGRTTQTTLASKSEFNQEEANFVYRSFKKTVNIFKPQKRTLNTPNPVTTYLNQSIFKNSAKTLERNTAHSHVANYR